MNYWLLKSEPETFSIDDLAKRKQQIAPWDGVRNYQARNFLQQMKKGDLGFFYHSSCEPPGIVGVMEIVAESYPDPTAFDSKSSYFDANSSPDKPRWFCVDVKLVKKFSQMITLSEVRANKNLHDMILLRKGNRLSVMPVTDKQWKIILNLESMNGAPR